MDFREAYAKLGRGALWQKQYFDHSVKGKEYREGEMVWLFSPAKKVGCSPKLQRWWSGPWAVREVITPVLHRLQWGQKKRVVKPGGPA